MNRTPTPFGAFLLGLTAGVGAGLLALFLGLISLEFVTAFSSDDVVGANIGAGLIAMAVTLVAAPFLAWPLLRLFRLPRPLATALFSVPFHLAFAVLLLGVAPATEDLIWERFPEFAEVTGPVVPWYLLDLVGIALAVAFAALSVALHGRRRGVDPDTDPATSTPTTP